MPGLLCLQGGHEFTADCEEMDTAFLARIGSGPVAVLAGAARPGSDYVDASDRARRYYERLGAEFAIIPDARDDEHAALDAMTDGMALVVLPGGSPSNLIDVLRTPVGARLVEMYEAGTAISGASAGAMVMCTLMVRPSGPEGADIIDGLALVDGLALPHWTPGTDRNWPVPNDATVWGLPECGGVVIDGDTCTAVGHGEPSRRVDGAWTAIER